MQYCIEVYDQKGKKIKTFYRSSFKLAVEIAKHCESLGFEYFIPP